METAVTVNVVTTAVAVATTTAVINVSPGVKEAEITGNVRLIVDPASLPETSAGKTSAAAIPDTMMIAGLQEGAVSRLLPAVGEATRQHPRLHRQRLYRHFRVRLTFRKAEALSSLASL